MVISTLHDVTSFQDDNLHWIRPLQGQRMDSGGGQPLCGTVRANCWLTAGETHGPVHLRENHLYVAKEEEKGDRRAEKITHSPPFASWYHIAFAPGWWDTFSPWLVNSDAYSQPIEHWLSPTQQCWFWLYWRRTIRPSSEVNMLGIESSYLQPLSFLILLAMQAN